MDELPPKARALLEAARRAEDPTPSERSRSERALRSALAAHGVTGLPPLAERAPDVQRVEATPRPRGRVGLPLKVGAALIAFAGAAYFGVTLRSANQPRAAQPLAAAVAGRANAGASERADTASRREGQPSLSPPPASRADADLDKRSSERVLAPVKVERSNAARATRSQRESNRSDDDLAAQLKTLASANQLVRDRSFAAAVQLLDRTETPSAVTLREEREGLRVLARCGLSADAPARRERDAFLRQYPHAILADRVRNACANQPPEVQ